MTAAFPSGSSAGKIAAHDHGRGGTHSVAALGRDCAVGTAHRCRVDAAAPPDAIARLSPREGQVAVVVARGLTNMQVARLLSMSPRTVESHLSRIYAKLHVRSRYELARLLGILGRPGENAAALAALSPRELEVISLVGTGMSNRQAARLLFVSPKTVEFHLARVFAKLQVSSREQLYRIIHSCEACYRSTEPPGP